MLPPPDGNDAGRSPVVMLSLLPGGESEEEDGCLGLLGLECSTTRNPFCLSRSFQRKQRDKEWNQSDDWLLEQMVGNG